MRLQHVLAMTAVAIGPTACSGRSGRIDGLYYETRGAGPAVVLIHGGQMDLRIWDEQVQPFARELRVIRYDIRGFGRSAAPSRPYSNTDDLAGLLRELGVEKAAFVGSSLGGAIATDFAIVHPELVEALVLSGPGLGGFNFTDPANDLRSATVTLWLKANVPFANGPHSNVPLFDTAGLSFVSRPPIPPPADKGAFGVGTGNGTQPAVLFDKTIAVRSPSRPPCGAPGRGRSPASGPPRSTTRSASAITGTATITISSANSWARSTTCASTAAPPRGRPPSMRPTLSRFARLPCLPRQPSAAETAAATAK